MNRLLTREQFVKNKDGEQSKRFIFVKTFEDPLCFFYFAKISRYGYVLDGHLRKELEGEWYRAFENLKMLPWRRIY